MQEHNDKCSSSTIEKDGLVTPEVDAAESINDTVLPLLLLNLVNTSNVYHAAGTVVIIPGDIAAVVVLPLLSLNVNSSSHKI